METSEKLDKLATALTKAQSEMGGAVKDSNNPFFKSKYADLTSVWKACKEALHNNDFSVIQSPISRDNRIGVATMLLHSSGQWVSDEFTLGVKKQNDPQADGSSITYARRYALAAFVGVCPVDDDGELAMSRNNKKTSKGFLDKMKGYAINEPEAYKKVLNRWKRDSAKTITNTKDQERILADLYKEVNSNASL
jgi:hypothetical protein